MNNFVISLTSAKERRKHICDEFAKHNLNFSFFDALEPSEELSTLIQQLLPNLAKSDLTNTEKACFMSHFVLIKQCVEQQLDYFSIFEDDIFLGSNSHLFLSNSNWIENMNKKVSIIKLEAFPLRVTLANKIAQIENRKICKIISPYIGAAGYILTKEQPK